METAGAYLKRHDAFDLKMFPENRAVAILSVKNNSVRHALATKHVYVIYVSIHSMG